MIIWWINELIQACTHNHWHSLSSRSTSLMLEEKHFNLMSSFNFKISIVPIMRLVQILLSNKNDNQLWPDVQNAANLLSNSFSTMKFCITRIMLNCLLGKPWRNRWKTCFTAQQQHYLGLEKPEEAHSGMWMKLWGGWSAKKRDFISMLWFEWSISRTI